MGTRQQDEPKPPPQPEPPPLPEPIPPTMPPDEGDPGTAPPPDTVQ